MKEISKDGYPENGKEVLVRTHCGYAVAHFDGESWIPCRSVDGCDGVYLKSVPTHWDYLQDDIAPIENGDRLEVEIPFNSGEWHQASFCYHDYGEVYVICDRDKSGAKHTGSGFYREEEIHTRWKKIGDSAIYTDKVVRLIEPPMCDLCNGTGEDSTNINNICEPCFGTGYRHRR